MKSMKIRYEVNNYDISRRMGTGSRFESQKEAFELAKKMAKQDRFGKAVMTKLVWDENGFVTVHSCIVKANGNWELI